MKLNKKRASRHWRVELGSPFLKIHTHAKAFSKAFQAFISTTIAGNKKHETR